MEGDIAAVRDIDLTDTAGGRSIHDLNLVAAVDDGPETGAILLDVVADITESEDGGRIGLGIDVAEIFARLEIEAIEGTLVTAHISFVEDIEAGGRGGIAGTREIFGVRAIEDVFATACDEEQAA